LIVGSGLVAAVVSVVFDRSRWRIVTFGLVAGVVSLFAVVATVGLVVPNYLMLTLPFWTLVAAAGWDWVARAVYTRLRGRTVIVRVVAAIAVVGLVALVVDVGSDVRQVHRRYEQLYANIRQASLVTNDQLGDACVLLARYTPQAGYYSHCRIAPFDDQELPDGSDWLAVSVDRVIGRWDLGVPPDTPIAVMLVEQANRQPDFAELTERTDLFGERLFEAGTSEQYRNHVIVLTVDPCVSGRTCETFRVPD
jgi:hypothetical protein